MMKYIAFTVKGLEQISAEEIESQGAVVLEQGTKRVIFEIDTYVNSTKFRTIDDLGIFLGSARVNSEQEIIDFIRNKDLKVKTTDGFSLTLSFSGATFDKRVLTKTLIKLINQKYGWDYLDRNHSKFDLRLFLDGKELFLAVRLTEQPLFHRDYRVASIKGALRPTIAAAMVSWASAGKTGLKLVDNFCGGGTILAEARALGHQVCGGDIDGEAIEAARTNLPGVDLRQQDALKTNWPDYHFDLAVSNLPWGQQIKIESVTQLYQGALAEYQRIVKSDGVICLLVSKPDLLIKLVKKIFEESKIESLKLGYLGQNPTMVKILR